MSVKRRRFKATSDLDRKAQAQVEQRPALEPGREWLVPDQYNMRVLGVKEEDYEAFAKACIYAQARIACFTVKEALKLAGLSRYFPNERSDLIEHAYSFLLGDSTRTFKGAMQIVADNWMNIVRRLVEDVQNPNIRLGERVQAAQFLYEIYGAHNLQSSQHDASHLSLVNPLHAIELAQSGSVHVTQADDQATAPERQSLHAQSNGSPTS